MALATLEQFKRHLGFKDADTQYDAKLTFFLDAASKWVESYCERIFDETIYTEFMHGNGSNILNPRQWPISAISEVRISLDRDWTSSDTLLDATDYGIEQNGLSILLFSTLSPIGYNVVRVIYTAGYASIPEDIQFANILAGEWFYKNNNRGDSGRTSIGKQGENASLLEDVPKIVRTILQSYKRFEVPSSALGAVRL